MPPTRRATRFQILLLASSLLPAAAPSLPPGDPLLALRYAVEESRDEAALRQRLQALAGAVGFRTYEQPARDGRRSFTLTLAEPVPARRLSRVMDWQRAYAISPDVHQQTWALRLWTGDLDDRHQLRIAVHTPHVGAWAMSPVLAERPKAEAELPALSAGGSPAYELSSAYSADVTAIQLELWVPGWQQPESVEVPTGVKPPAFAVSRSVIQGWIENHKGFGIPGIVDARHPDMWVFAAWNIPTSGINSTDYWVYCFGDPAGWRLHDAARFTPGGDQAHSAVVDPVRREVRFLGRQGEVYHRVPVADCRWQRP